MAVSTSKAGIEQIAFRMLARSGNVNQKRTTIEVGRHLQSQRDAIGTDKAGGCSDEYRATYDVPFIKGANNPEYIVINEFIARKEEILNKEMNKNNKRTGIDALTSDSRSENRKKNSWL